MLKKSKKLGKNILNQAEIQNISHSGIWLLANEQEYFMPFSQFPWFLQANLQQIYNLELSHGKYLHWPQLDIDVELDSLEHPEMYPLKYS